MRAKVVAGRGSPSSSQTDLFVVGSIATDDLDGASGFFVELVRCNDEPSENFRCHSPTNGKVTYIRAPKRLTFWHSPAGDRKSDRCPSWPTRRPSNEHETAQVDRAGSEPFRPAAQDERRHRVHIADPHQQLL